MRGIANSRKSSNLKLEHFKNKQDSARRSSALSAAKTHYARNFGTKNADTRDKA